jgi:hypothetical protein
VIFDAGASPGPASDRFHVRNIGLAVQRKMAGSGLSAAAFRARSADRLARILPASRGRRNSSDRAAFEALSTVLGLVPSIAGWSQAERRAVADIVDAKSGTSEIRYMRLLQRHDRLRKELLRLGSR